MYKYEKYVKITDINKDKVQIILFKNLGALVCPLFFRALLYGFAASSNNI